jgi:hypothetical protein
MSEIPLLAGPAEPCQPIDITCLFFKVRVLRPGTKAGFPCSQGRALDPTGGDPRREENATDEALAQQTVGLGEQPRSLDPDDTVVGENDIDVDIGADISAAGRVTHDPAPVLGDERLQYWR